MFWLPSLKLYICWNNYCQLSFKCSKIFTFVSKFTWYLKTVYQYNRAMFLFQWGTCCVKNDIIKKISKKNDEVFRGVLLITVRRPGNLVSAVSCFLFNNMWEENTLKSCEDKIGMSYTEGFQGTFKTKVEDTFYLYYRMRFADLLHVAL